MKDYDKSGVYTRNGEYVDFCFHTYLDVTSKVRFVKSVVDTIVTDESYCSVIKNIILDYNIVNYFTDVDLSEIDEADDVLGAIEKLIAETNIVDIVKKNALPGVIGELERSVDLDIEYRTGIHKNPVSESLSSLIDTVESKLSDVDMSALMDMANVINSVPGEFTADKMLDAFAKTDIYKENREHKGKSDPSSFRLL